MCGGGNSVSVYSISRLMMHKLFVVAQEHCCVVVQQTLFVSHFSLCIVYQFSFLLLLSRFVCIPKIWKLMYDSIFFICWN
jgi:hypothetical protein